MSFRQTGENKSLRSSDLLKRCNKMHVCVCVCVCVYVCVIALKVHFHLHICVIFIAEEGQYKITCQNASMDTTAKTKLY